MFYYYSSHGVPVGRFKSRVQWQGDVSRRDGSIRLHDLRLNDSGTYECELRLLEDSSIFRSQTELLVSSEPRGACPEPAASPAALGVPAVPSPRFSPAGEGAAGPEDAALRRDSGLWPAVVGCGCVAVVVAFLAGLCVRKRYQHWL